MQSPDDNFKSLGLILPPPPTPLGVYKPCLTIGNQLYISGHGPLKIDGSRIIGKVGTDLNIEEAKIAAQQVGLTILATIINSLGSLSKVKRVTKILGMVNCIDTFDRHPYVINGCSELFRNIWGEELGVGVRSAIGVGSLPENIPVEIEALFELH